MRFLDRVKNDLPYVALLGAMVLLLLLPLITMAGWPLSHENLRYLILSHYFQDGIQAGQFYPRWLPDLAGGYGYPTFLFYQPAFFYLALGCHLITGAMLPAIKLAVGLIFLTGGLGAYCLGRELFDRWAGLFAALLFLLVPYHYVNLYVRGDLSELLAVCLCPWPLFFLVRLKNHQAGPAWSTMAGLLLSLTLLIYAHPVTSMIFMGLLALFIPALMFAIPAHRSLFLVRCGLVVASGLALSSPYWFTVFQLTPYVNLDLAQQGPYGPAGNVVEWGQFFSRFWGFGGSVEGAGDGMAFALGLPHFGLAVLGGILGIGIRRWRVFFLVGLGGYLLLLVMMTGMSTAIWEKFWLLRAVQFPWRLLGLTATLQVACGLGIYGALKRRQTLRGPLLILGLVAAAVYHRPMFFPQAAIPNAKETVDFNWRYARYSFTTLSDINEFMPNSAKGYKQLAPRGAKPMMLFSPGVEAVVIGPPASHRIHFRATSPTPSEGLIRQFYFPGWAVQVNDRRLSATELAANPGPYGLIRIRLPAGESEILAWYEGPPGWRLRNGLIVIILAGALAGLWGMERWRRRVVSPA